MLSTLADPILPIFTILVLGFFAYKMRAFDVKGAQVINKFVFYFATPALVFNVISNAPVEELDYKALALYFSAQVIVYSAAFSLLYFVRRPRRPVAGRLGLGTPPLLRRGRAVLMEALQRPRHRRHRVHRRT